MDTITHIHSLTKVMVLINEHLGEVRMRGLKFENSLSFGQIEKDIVYWREFLKHFETA